MQSVLHRVCIAVPWGNTISEDDWARADDHGIRHVRTVNDGLRECKFYVFEHPAFPVQYIGNEPYGCDSVQDMIDGFINVYKIKETGCTLPS
jgi:hypothetical protein